MPPTNRRSSLQFFRYLPSDIVIDILSRLPIRTIVICKCVCRSWRDLLCSREFIDFHFTKSVPGLVIGEGLFQFGPDGLEVYEFVDELGLEHHDLHYKLLTKIDSVGFLRNSELQGSANGLVLLHRRFSGKHDALYVCNPITREYIELMYDRFVSPSTSRFTYGFGVSKITGQHKVVRIFICHGSSAHELQDVTMSICLVYTLGTGMWRSVAVPAPFIANDCSIGVCLNGNLHWVVKLLDVSRCILRFDLETETFSTLSLPSQLSESERYDLGLSVLGDCLSVTDHIEIYRGNIDHYEVDHEIVIWLMKEYGDVKSWTKEFVMKPSDSNNDFLESAVVHPIKVFKDGDIVIILDNMYMFYHDNRTKAIEQSELFGYHEFAFVRAMKAMLHTSSFFSLGSFANERVCRC